TVDPVRQKAMCLTAPAARVSRLLRFLAQAREHPVEHSERPAAIIKQIGAQHVGAIELAGIVRFDPVEWNQRSATATFDRRRITALVRHEMLERSQKKGTQTALFLSHRLEIFAL